ncbi:pyruvate:ferredoxin (flavodoxin) oxidoreductase [Schwartzia succinivorans]|uniref:Pyruvate-ferredoxin/flavodoxin oxidoreductase n=1 Tax=Schwartzia succinivorans DSM 10502 TaxID=1123243 RepID=A0A1M4T6D7_9FIRM|nr:pyruvate:ferredoxin (flavodoxin) oxidoreductase [Schwartzia succinivorans]MBQ3863708.1 pyruvate:ferredoxin (flavodoxin) oxidoreductase [Schwartzia sp. (in: firmicutes)]MBQ5413448.1 pyruvate:ferredoxin (flavodoxin) oxidoreductase [Schwartzia sp. (in: firmicutes)]SHE40086.1 pyruvate-ferredoxin/flavodoxin oxidoreductase [Schwartzia succinivorans DSM 10502]
MSKHMKTMDGNTAAAYVSYAFTDVAAIYPITPSSPMAEHVDEMAAHGKKNLFGQKVRLIEMESEGGAAGAVHGSLQAGALTTTYTASQGMMLMIPNMYKVSGELLPGVFHVSARALATSSLNIFGDHQDVMAARQTGVAMLAENSVQEVMDLAAVAHLVAIKGRIPFVNFFDGFRTSHEIQKIEVIDYADFDKLLDHKAVEEFRHRALNPDHPVIRGTSTNPDVYFQMRESVNNYYEAIPDLVEETMAELAKITGREHHVFDYYGASDADRVIIAIGSFCETAKEVVDYLNANGEKVGVLCVHLYRPFSLKYFFKALPKTAQKIAVLERTKEPGALGEPLYLDVCSAFFESGEARKVVGGRYGLGGKDVTPDQIFGVFEELKKDAPKNHFTIGIEDDVTNTSIAPAKSDVDLTPEGTTACKFWGFGSDGTVGANKSAIKIIGDNTDMYAQAYFAYDSKKSGGITISHLRFGSSPIRSPYLINKANFISCSKESYVTSYDLLAGLKPGGTFLLNTTWTEAELDEHLPAAMRRYIANNNIKFYIINAVKIAQELGLGGRFNMIMQSAFFKLANIIPLDKAVKYLKDSVVTSYGNKGQKVIDMNNGAIDKGIDPEALIEVKVPASWKDAADAPQVEEDVPAYVKNIQMVMNRQEGDKLPVSTFTDYADGTFDVGSAAYEKRGVAILVPEWQSDLCIQCNQCSFVCPHAAIRPVLTTDEEKGKAPSAMEFKPALGAKDLNFTIAVSQKDCLGCGNCAEVCPAPKGKALVMKPLGEQIDKQPVFDYAVKEVAAKPNPMNKKTVKGSQFEQPLLEFSGACAGCGETPYAKLITQLFGDRMMIANATGCSSIWGASAPSMPYTKNAQGHGPAWANSLFEDNAEYGLGMFLGTKAVRETLADDFRAALEAGKGSDELKAALQDWLDNINNGEGTRERADKLTALLEKEKGSDELLNKIYDKKDFFVKRSQWIIGGDGWSYDIGYGGLDHVLASNEDVNVLVLDTEVYSNTGGQSSKSTPTAAIAQFAATGKKTKKKDLGMMAMSYGYVYVAQIAMGSDKNQAIKAITEAEAYPGPSLIIAYAPCINHGIRAGMGKSQLEEKRAVDCGYWATYRYNPELVGTDKNPFVLDSKEPTADFQEFLQGEVRFSSLKRAFPDIAEELYQKTEKDAKTRLAGYQKLAGK